MSERRGGASLERRVAWREGMHLHPQHFQQQDRAQSAHAWYRERAADPFPWGVIDLAIDEDRLAAGTVHVSRLAVILEESGTILEARDHAVPDRDVRTLAGEGADEREAGLDALANAHKKGTRFPVFIGIKRPTDRGDTFSEHGGDRTRRFQVDSQRVTDFTHDDPSVRQVDVLRTNARLLFEGEAEQENCEAMQIALVEATGDPKQAYRLVEEYVPPLMRIGGAPGLRTALENLLKRMHRRVPELARRTASVDAGDIKWLFVRNALARAIAGLEHLLTTDGARPFEIYGVLADTAASLGSMDALEPPALPAYQPYDLGGCFSDLIRRIDDELEKSWTDRFRKLPMAFRADAVKASERIYEVGPLSTDLQRPGNTYYLAIQQPAGVEDSLVDEVVATRKAGDPRELPMLVEEAMNGVAFKPRDAPPVEISGPRGFLYYEIDPNLDGDSIDHWEQVMRPNGSFAVHLGVLEEVETVLYVVFPKEG